MPHATDPKTIALHSIRIESPCTASWASMKGDERVRHCGDCNKSVFNLSAMPEAEAAALLADDTDGELCVRFYQRADGTVMTSDCSTSARAYTRRTLRKMPGMAGAALLAVSASGFASADPQPAVAVTPPPIDRDVGTMMMGAPMAPVVPVAPVAPVAIRAKPAVEVVRVTMGKPMVEPLQQHVYPPKDNTRAKESTAR